MKWGTDVEVEGRGHEGQLDMQAAVGARYKRYSLVAVAPLLSARGGLRDSTGPAEANPDDLILTGIGFPAG